MRGITGYILIRAENQPVYLNFLALAKASSDSVVQPSALRALLLSSFRRISKILMLSIYIYPFSYCYLVGERVKKPKRLHPPSFQNFYSPIAWSFIISTSTENTAAPGIVQCIECLAWVLLGHFSNRLPISFLSKTPLSHHVEINRILVIRYH